jgi:hypothetical protein
MNKKAPLGPAIDPSVRHRLINLVIQGRSDLSVPSIVNWFSNTIDDGDLDAALYVAEVVDHPGYVVIAYCTLDAVDRLESISHIGRIRYITCADPEICASRSRLSLKDCWLAEQFLLFQLSEYREFVSLDQATETHPYDEMIKLPDTGASRFIEWIVETSQKIFCDPQVGYRLCLDSLVTTSRQRLLYEKFKLE